jgi:1-hydroxycarotenoid 3,4-desaturase
MSQQRQSLVAPATPGPKARPVVVIGAGIGGLACAVDLARSGREVLVLERASVAGGKLREVEIDGRPLDAGPTVFTMRWVFDELFAAAGARLEDHLSLRAAEVLARHAWSRDERLDLFADIDRSSDAIDAFSGVGEGARYRDFCSRAGAVFRTLERPFIRGSRPTPLSLATRVGWRGLPGLTRISPFATLWSRLGQQFRDPRLRQLFGRYATYCGSSPFLSPATLMLVAHVEQQGVWLVDGGMHRVASAVAGLAERVGATLRFDSHVREIVIRNGRVDGVLVGPEDSPRDLEFIAADAVVFNGDVAALGAGLLGTNAKRAAAPVEPAQRSLSAITLNVVGCSQGFPLLRHNVFFGTDYRDEFDAIFQRGGITEAPTVYVCAQDRDHTGACTTEHAERLLCLVNAPARGDSSPLDSQEISRCLQRMNRVLARCGLQIEAASDRTITTTPSDFERLFPGSGGALYGRASHGWAASFSRPGSRSRIPGIYLAGGTVHPGPGVPMAALSGRQAATSVLSDRHPGRASMSRFPRQAMPGGMSTR